jgi:NAD(P)-dependent dehydrogenase (short-subunit alcohol dehydrogenase family)
MGVSSSKPHPIEAQWFPEFKKNLPSLENKTIAITGTTSGTGQVIAQTSVDKGAATVLLLNRPSDRATKAEADLRKSIPEGSKTNVESIPCDLQDFESVKQAASLIKSKYEAIDVLCNNAGVMALEDVATKDGYDVQMQTNHLSHFLLTKELYPLLKKARDLRGEARVVHHSSAARKLPGTPLEAKYLEKNGGNLGGNGSSMFFGGARWQRYHQTKLANAVMTLALRDRFGDSGIKAAAAAPGLAATNLQVTTNQQGGMGWGMWIMRFAQSAEDGTMPLAAACFDPSTNNGDFWEPEGSGNMKGPAVKVEYDKLSSDEASRKMLWEKSEEACGEFKID